MAPYGGSKYTKYKLFLFIDTIYGDTFYPAHIDIYMHTQKIRFVSSTNGRRAKVDIEILVPKAIIVHGDPHLLYKTKEQNQPYYLGHHNCISAKKQNKTNYKMSIQQLTFVSYIFKINSFKMSHVSNGWREGRGALC